MDDPPTSPVDRFRTANLLGAFALEVATAQERATTEAIGQGGAAAAALDAVAASPGHTIEHLRGALGITQPGAARLFERLEAAGWVQRGGRGGRSGFQITLTDAGEAKLASILAARRRVLLDLLAHLDDAELTDLTALLDQLLAARTTGPEALQRICRLCERSACHQCPVGHAVDLQNAQRDSGD
jgi:DNA-binding MarR family transcriptional regulator